MDKLSITQLPIIAVNVFTCTPRIVGQQVSFRLFVLSLATPIEPIIFVSIFFKYSYVFSSFEWVLRNCVDWASE